MKNNVGLLKYFLHETHSNPTEFWLNSAPMMWSIGVCTDKKVHE